MLQHIILLKTPLPNYHGFRAEDVDVNDGSHLFKLLDDGDGNLTHTEFLGDHKLLVFLKNTFLFVLNMIETKVSHVCLKNIHKKTAHMYVKIFWFQISNFESYILTKWMLMVPNHNTFHTRFISGMMRFKGWGD